MAMTNAIRALAPVWFRFTDDEDKGKYGEEWFRYDEAAILRLPARELIALETDLGMPLVAVMNGFRDNTVLGDTAVAWMGLRSADLARAGDFDTFNPLVMTIEWSSKDPEPAPKDGLREPTLQPEDSDLSIAGPSGSMTSAPMDTVDLDTMPVVGSGTS